MTKKAFPLENIKEVGARLAAARERAGLTQSAAAAKLGIKQQNLSRYESGLVEPSLGLVVTLADIYNESVGSLLTGAASSTEMADWPWEIAGPVQKIIDNWEEMAPEVAPVVAGLLDRAGDMASRRGYFDWIDAPLRRGRVGLTHDERRDLGACAEILRHGGPAAQAVRGTIESMAEMIRATRSPVVSENTVPLGRVAEPQKKGKHADKPQK